MRADVEAIQSATVRELELRGQAMRGAVEELIAMPALTWTSAVGHIDGQRITLGRAVALAKGNIASPDAHETLRRDDAALQCFGRLLFFLRFDKHPNDATAEERELCDRLRTAIRGSTPYPRAKKILAG